MPTKYLSCAHRPPKDTTEYHDIPCVSCPPNEGGAMGLFVDPDVKSLPRGMRFK